MKREIKFRGKRETDGKWIYGSLVTGLFYNHKTKEDVCNILDTEENPDFDCMQDLDDIDTDVETKTVGQFTSLTDKNGKEIYEGDILKMPFDTGIAYVINDGFMYCVKYPGSEAVDYETSDVFEASEVIGNIHDNQELLK